MATTNKAFRVKTGLVVEGGALFPATGTITIAPIVFTSGVNLSTATAGAFEYDGTNFYLTPASTRKTIAFTDLIPSAGTSTTLGTIKLFSDTSQTVAATAVSATASRTYGLQINASGQGVINVPWSDTNTPPSTFAYTDGTTAGPTGSLTGTGMTAVAFAAIPSASATVSGIVTTAGQTFAGVKTFSSSPVISSITNTGTLTLPTSTDTLVGRATSDSLTNKTYNALSITAPATGATLTITNLKTLAVQNSLTLAGTDSTTMTFPTTSATIARTDALQTFTGVQTFTSPAVTTSLTTASTSFDLLNTTATTVNFAGAGTSVNIGASSGNTTVNNSLVVTGNLTVNGTTTTVNSTVVTVDDILLELGSVTTPTDTTANGGGISVKGATDKTFTWSSTGANWTASENLSLATGKTFKINNVDVLSATTLGTAVVSSSLTKVGALSSGTAGFVKVDASGNLTSDSNTYLTSSTGVTTVNGSSGAISNVALTTGKLSQFAATTSAELLGVVSDETGSGALVFAGSPALTGTPTINAVAGLVTASGSTTGTTALTLSTVYSSSTYNGGEFIVKATNGSNIEITKILVVTDGTNVYVTNYGDVFVTSSLVTVDFTYTTGNVNMVLTPVAGTTGTTSVKVSGTLLAV